MSRTKHLNDLGCCVKGCKSSPLRTPDKSFFPFPKPDLHPVKVQYNSGILKELDLRSMWTTLCHVDPEAAQDAVVCSKHFRNQDFQSVVTNGCMIPKLKSQAIPSIFLNQPVEIKTKNEAPEIKTFKTSKVYFCHICQLKCKSRIGLSKHLKVHQNKVEKRYKCSKCNFKSRTFAAFKKHNRIKHSFEIAEHNDSSLNINKLDTSVKQHKAMPGGSQSQPTIERICNLCNYKALGVTDFSEHLINHVLQANPGKIDPSHNPLLSTYMCVMCDFGCEQFESYSDHLLKHKFSIDSNFKKKVC